MTKSATRSFADELGIDDNATSTAVTIDASENVGIGTASPAYRLDVVGDSSTQVLTRVDNTNQSTNTGSGIRFDSSVVGGTQTAQIYTHCPANNTVNLIFEQEINGTNGVVETMRIDSAGHAIIGGGVTLGNGQTYAASNTLDDYEEGTWTPTHGGNNMIVHSAKYTKVGDTVFIQADVTSAAGSTTSNYVGGLPFTVGDYHSCWTSGYSNGASLIAGGYVQENTNYLRAIKNGTTTTANIVAGNRFMFTAQYKI